MSARKGRRPPRRQAQVFRRVAIAEVVDVTPVIGDLLRACRLFQEALDRRCTARTRDARHVDVETFFLDLQPELQGLHRPLLPDDRLQSGHLGAAFAADLFRRANPPQLFVSQF
jgi:hypothetical protein